MNFYVQFDLFSILHIFLSIMYITTKPLARPWALLSHQLLQIILQNLESRVIGTLPFNLPFYFQYIDDIALSVSSSILEFTLNSFNSIHLRVQFTLEEDIDNRLNFLDVTIIIKDNFIEFDWYHKPTL